MLNRDADVKIFPQGHEQAPVIVIDDCLADPADWMTLARESRYEPMGAYYPGIRATVPAGRAAIMREQLGGLLRQAFAIAHVPPVLETFFSLVTTPPAALAPIQRLPHFDGVEEDRFAVLVFLSGTAGSGTAFYRHRATGFESVTAARLPSYEAQLQADVQRCGLPPPAYIAGDTPLFEQVARYEARPNRALIYRSNLLHCAWIGPDTPLSADPAVGRLTINSFLFGKG
jgi:Family of unknown function (DUF6445)